MHAVAELVGEREHIAPSRGVVEQHVGLDRRHARRAERPAALGRAHGRVDALLVKEALCDGAELSGEGRVAIEHDLAGAREREADLVLADRRHTVVVGQTIDAEQPGLQPIPASRDLIAAAHRFDQRLHGLVAGLVGEVARGKPARVMTQSVVDALVGEQRIEQERSRAQPRRERVGHCQRGRAPGLAVGQRQAAERDVQRDRLAVAVPIPLAGAGRRGQLHLDCRGELLEQPRPRPGTGERLLGEDLLLGLCQQVVAVAANVAQMVAAELQAVACEQLLHARIVQRGPLQVEEQQRRLDRRAALLGRLQECSVGRVGGVGGETQRSVGSGATDQVVDLRELPHRLAQPVAVELAELAGVALGELLRACQRLGEAALDAVRAVAVDERFEIPGGRLQLGIGRLRGARSHRPPAYPCAAPRRAGRRRDRAGYSPASACSMFRRAARRAGSCAASSPASAATNSSTTSVPKGIETT